MAGCFWPCVLERDAVRTPKSSQEPFDNQNLHLSETRSLTEQMTDCGEAPGEPLFCLAVLCKALYAADSNMQRVP